ncbi:MAG: hypothetical protein CM1200mP15_06360 [Dehalococcoidia bacterium]|nr:MAG: hypothetical protein CM1200mP15_06360 [Dehalococcoidia bacterium]
MLRVIHTMRPISLKSPYANKPMNTSTDTETIRANLNLFTFHSQALVDLSCEVPCAESIVNIHGSNTRGTAVKHS